jgi:hypothetical protein
MGRPSIRSTLSLDARAAGAIDCFVPVRVGSRGGSSRSSQRAPITVTRVIGAVGYGTGRRYQASERGVRRWSSNAERAKRVRPPRAGCGPSTSGRRSQNRANRSSSSSASLIARRCPASSDSTASRTAGKCSSSTEASCRSAGGGFALREFAVRWPVQERRAIERETPRRGSSRCGLMIATVADLLAYLPMGTRLGLIDDGRHRRAKRSLTTACQTGWPKP